MNEALSTGPATTYGTSPIKRNRRCGSEMEDLLQQIRKVLGGYEEQITIRHLFYRLAGMGVIEKSETAYKSLCTHLSKWRKSRDIPFGVFVDGTRWHYGATTFSDEEEALGACVKGYRKNLWQSQDVYVEVWSEKDAIASILTPLAGEWGIKTFVCRGFASITSLYSAGSAFQAEWNRGKTPHLLYMGDHDPSGVAMDGSMARAWDYFGFKAPIFKRVAVLPGHIEQFSLATRPVKPGDTRAKNWSGGCVEVDTLTPVQIRGLLEKEIVDLVDPDQWARTKLIEEAEKESLRTLRSFHLINKSQEAGE